MRTSSSFLSFFLTQVGPDWVLPELEELVLTAPPFLSKVRSCAYLRGINIGACAGLIWSPALRKIRITFRYGKGITLRYAQGRSFPSLCSLKPTRIPAYTNYGRTGITVLCRIVRTLLVNTAWNGRRKARSGNGVESEPARKQAWSTNEIVD